jgi:selenocysteine-specific elongation factor
MLIVGTAGHIDHGKSSLVRRLTGSDPDRLPEEKARGMTIDLGFAFMDAANDERVAFVDVPGHERFVRNMIAGAGGIDVVMLVIAADDGWMPQSEEHFQVVRMLGVRHGVIAINKCDLVDADWLELLTAEVSEKVAGSFLEDAPIFPVSAQTGAGLDKLQSYIASLPQTVRSRHDFGEPRLYVDRSFIREGIGGVVTGTLSDGELKSGEIVHLYPSKQSGKIRSLHANNRETEIAYPGQRTAITFSSIDRKHLMRGSVVTTRDDLDFFDEHPILAIKAELLTSGSIDLEDRRRLTLLIGTSETDGEVRLFGAEKVRPGEGGMLFIKPDDPIFALIGDHLVLRLPTPQLTLGGGQVVDHLKHFPRRKQLDRYAYLNDRNPNDAASLIETELRKRLFVPTRGLLKQAHIDRSELSLAKKKLKSSNMIDEHNDYLHHVDSVATLSKKLSAVIDSTLSNKSHLRGLTEDELVRLLSSIKDISTPLLSLLVTQEKLTREGNLYNLPGRGTALTGDVKRAYEEIVAALHREPFSPPALKQLAGGGKAHKDAIRFLIESGEVVKIGSEFLLLSDSYDQIVAFIAKTLNDSRELTVAQLRDKFSMTRKFLIPLLEETDRRRLTERDGDVRRKGDRFAQETAAL